MATNFVKEPLLKRGYGKPAAITEKLFFVFQHETGEEKH